jgi:hypothetical protein
LRVSSRDAESESQVPSPVVILARMVVAQQDQGRGIG